jgi:uncharacterized protein YcnI
MRKIRTIATAAVLAGVGTLVLAGVASAHVTVTSPGATQGGGDQEITFRVPVEKDANTIGLKLSLPTDTPIASVDVEPVAGWTHTEKTVKLAKPIVTDDGDITEAVSEIDWTAQPGQGLVPGEFGAFTIIAGQLPETPSLTFKAIQIYSDGTQVAWTQTEAPGSTADLDNPAPVLPLAPSTQDLAAQASTHPKAPANTTPLVLAIIAVVFAAGALGVAISSRIRKSP